MKEFLKKEFTKEDIERLRAIVLERSTFYTREIVDYKILKLKSQDEDIVKSIQSIISYNFKNKEVLDKLYELLKWKEKIKMRCKGNFVYKSLTTREGGEFTNPQGQVIKYDTAYILKVDEETDNGIMERKFKFPTTNKEFAKTLGELSSYTRVCIEFDVSFFNNQVRLLPIGLVEE